jgi:hypothetical protein
VIEAVEQAKGEQWAEFRDRHGDWGRDLVLYLGRKQCGLKWKELSAVAGGIDYVSASTAVRRLEQRLLKVPALSRALKRVQTQLEMQNE